MAGEAEKPTFRIELLGGKHDRAAFSCGVDLLDVYLCKQASQDFKKHAAAPFVLPPDGSTIAGYYTLSQYAAQLDHVPPEVARKLPRYPVVPTTLIGRLAVSTTFHGQGHGETLLMDALHRILQHSGEVAVPFWYAIVIVPVPSAVAANCSMTALFAAPAVAKISKLLSTVLPLPPSLLPVLPFGSLLANRKPSHGLYPEGLLGEWPDDFRTIFPELACS